MTLIALVIVGFLAHRQLRSLTLDWAGYWEAGLEAAADQLGSDLDGLIGRGEDAVRAAALVDATAANAASRLAQIRSRAGLAALVVYDGAGTAVVWDGEHQGVVPDEARFGVQPYVSGGSPLYSYLYLTAPVEGGGTVVGAELLSEELPSALRPQRASDFASEFTARSGETVLIHSAELVEGDGVWDLHWDDRVLFSARIEQPAQGDRRTRVLLFWGRCIAGLALLALVLLAAGAGDGERRWGVGTAVLTLAAVVPVGELLGLTGATVADFLLPGPVPAPLGRVVSVALAAVFLAGGLRPRARGLGPGLALVSVGVAFPIVLLWLRQGAAAQFLAADGSWVAYQGAVALVLSTVAALALRLGRARGAARPRPLMVLLGLASAAAFAALAAAAVRRGVEPGWATSAAWGLPAALVALGLGTGARWRQVSLLWLTAGLLGGTAALSYSWSDRVSARVQTAEVQLSQLGPQADPFLEFMLERLGREMADLQDRARRPIEWLFEAWTLSGLADEGYPLWFTLWTPENLPREELPIGVGGARPTVAAEFLDEARRDAEGLIRRFALDDANYLALFPLQDGWVGTAVVPARRSLLRSSQLGPLFASVQGSRPSPLELVPLPPSRGLESGEAVRWSVTENGYRGELLVSYPSGPYRAQYRVELPGSLLTIARGTLLLLLSLVVFLGVHVAGQLVQGRVRPEAMDWEVAARSFRARVTLALFGFFVLSTVVIGGLAYRVLTGATLRTATVLAERVAEEAADGYLSQEGELGRLARRVGADLLLYRDGELAEGAVHELVELGLYPGLLPYGVFRSLANGNSITASASTNFGQWEYVMAYRRLAAGDVMASPAGLEAGALALRRREVADVLGFALVFGAALSLALALLVGRTLTRPMQTLRVASERVGSGNLSVRLPEDRADEFGSVFAAFNRMVQRLGTTREALVRTTQRTEAIVAEAATGVIAIDPDAMVVLVNPRAEALLGADIPVGEILARDGGTPIAEFGRWVLRFLDRGALESSTEFTIDDRRVRVKARRISRRQPLGGAVFSLEDVTDELRSERILAWGQMARQVAHEVKNPLTPMKLSVQHIERAWKDRRGDFDAILERNVDAVLREIDRLADIAGSFSRLSAPGTGSAPLDSVSVSAVVAEVAALYRGGEEVLPLDVLVAPALPAVYSRAPELKEVLINLLENARWAVADGGRVALAATETADGDVQVDVRDNGVGIPSDQLLQIFEPHFSTRSAGTGLGLAIVRRLVESWEGTVRVESEEGGGTVVTLVLRGQRVPGGESGQDAPPSDESPSFDPPPLGEGV